MDYTIVVPEPIQTEIASWCLSFDAEDTLYAQLEEGLTQEALDRLHRLSGPGFVFIYNVELQDPLLLGITHSFTIWVPTLQAANDFRDAVREIRGAYHLKASHEFKFSRTHGCSEHRQAFFCAALTGEFRFVACTIDKTAGEWRHASAADMHYACAVHIATGLRTSYRETEASLPPRDNGKPRFLHESVIVDDNQDASYLKILERAFRGLQSVHGPNVPMVSRVRFRESGPDEMLQLADMVCGAIGAHVSEEMDSSWYNMIAGRCVGLTTLP